MIPTVAKDIAHIVESEGVSVLFVKNGYAYHVESMIGNSTIEIIIGVSTKTPKITTGYKFLYSFKNDIKQVACVCFSYLFLCRDIAALNNYFVYETSSEVPLCVLKFV